MLFVVSVSVSSLYFGDEDVLTLHQFPKDKSNLLSIFILYSTTLQYHFLEHVIGTTEVFEPVKHNAY